MVQKFNIVRFTKVISLTLVLLSTMLAKGYVNPYLDTEVEKNKKEVSTKTQQEESVPSISNVTFEATLSFFAVEFDDLSQYVMSSAIEIPIVNEPADSKIVVSTFKFFRVMFSRILSINAP